MLTSVLNLVAKPLEHALRSYQRRDPKNVQIEPLLRTLKDNLALSRRTGGAEQNEVETWSGPATGGLAVTVKHTVASFIPWALHPRLNAMPTPYTHRQLLYGIKVLGAPRILRIILEELQQQTEAGNASIAFDIASALICAPDVTSDVLPAALQTLDESGNTTQKDPALAEAVVRLYRKVEAQMTPSQAQILQADLEASLDTSDAVQAAANAAAAAAAVAGAGPGDPMQMDSVGLDMMAGVTGSDFGMGGSANGGSSLLSMPRTSTSSSPTNLNADFQVSFPDADIFGVKIVNGKPTKAVIDVTNNEEDYISVEFITGNLTTMSYGAKLAPGEKVSLPYSFAVDMFPQDVEVRLLAVASNSAGGVYQLQIGTNAASVVDPPVSIFDPQIIFLYLFLTGSPHPARKPKAVEPVVDANLSGSESTGFATGKSYDESWIPESHIRPAAKRVKTSGSAKKQ
ncbi:unnamed protein product [Parascedosporium putredinis]|uniref:Mediator of RNA polymerase II transcription subunit 5 n=1 Tax=Parascedosporium putredinis TaxID=1442378 RepID=A0A9P1GUW1_9PEZI|nr:unnamed protein product [Parascedosporium putredinis]CAI7987548.1 unnamed protein product [Parascedosporium putredinis]